VAISPWHTPAVLTWLQTILLERFGHLFILQIVADGKYLAMQLPGDERHITLTLEGSTFTRADSDLPCTNWYDSGDDWYTVMGPSIPAPGVSTLPFKLIEPTNYGWHIHYDILGLVYWMLARVEEIGRTDLDNHGRFPATSSHAFKHGYLDRPVVDEWLHVLGQLIQRQWPGIELKRHEFQMRVSHDVDQPSLYAFKPWKTIARMMVGHILKRRDPKAFFTAPYVKIATRNSLNKADPFNTFDWLMDVSERNGLKSTFYFICGRTDPAKDADYEIDHPVMRNLLRHIHSRGHEIGLHPSYNAVHDPVVIKKEFQNLTRVCLDEKIEQRQWGGRMHYLRCSFPSTILACSNAGLSYDASLGYADRPGFRCGTCFDYPGFDSVNNKTLNITIRPLIVMESTLIESPYLGLGVGVDALNIALSLKNSCKNVNGGFNILWHNSSLVSNSHRNMYLAVMS
jgi:hypothetical protein